MIITKLISGLGNQLMQYALARQLSLLKEVPLKLDLTFFDSQNLRSYKLDHYNIDAEIATTADIQPFRKEINDYQKLHQQTSLSAKLYRNIEPLIYPKFKKKYFKEHIWWILEPSIFKTPADVYIEGYWQHYKYFENVQVNIFEELTLKEPLNFKAADWLFTIKNNPSTVAVHIRRGDYVTDSGANYLMGVLSVEYYKKAITYIKQKIVNPVFFFFSDDLDWVKNNIQTDTPVYYVDGNVDYVDLDLMKNCNHNITANSTFSWWAAFLNRNPSKIVITPNQWSPREDVNKNIHLQFPSWVKL